MELLGQLLQFTSSSFEVSTVVTVDSVRLAPATDEAMQSRDKGGRREIVDHFYVDGLGDQAYEDGNVAFGRRCLAKLPVLERSAQVNAGVEKR